MPFGESAHYLGIRGARYCCRDVSLDDRDGRRPLWALADSPVVFLATKAGPNAQRSNAHFGLDVEYLRQLSEPLATQWALRYFGDWHSHHRLGLLEPSSGDRRRIRQLGNRNQFPGMAEIIVTTEGLQHRPIVRLHPWFYDLSVEGDPAPMATKVLPGCSPIRQALIARGNLPEQSPARLGDRAAGSRPHRR